MPTDQIPGRILRSSTLTEQVYRLLKERIVSGGFRAGEHLVERQLAKEYDISKTPVREALARLEKEGLVEFEAGKGMRIRSLKAEDVTNILELRELLEGFAAEKAALLCTEQELDKLETVLRESQALPLSESEQYLSLDEEFHNLVWQLSHNPTLVSIMKQLRNQIRIVMSTTIRLPRRRELSLAEHQAIFDAIKARDAQAAALAARTHMHHALQAVQQHYKKEENA
jgi:DNA-binding GntR family transcriptional regulator